MHVQIVTFKLRPDASRKTFLKLTEEMVNWLRNKSGFVAYELYEGSGCWFDRIAWESESHAHNGLKDFQNTAIAKQMMLLIENDYSRFFGDAVTLS